MITESEIDVCIEKLENDPGSALEIPPEFTSYLQSEVYPNLKEYERQILAFSLSIIHNCCASKFEELFDLEYYLDNEESNWSIRDKDSSLDDSLNIFFNGYPEEDLLAFVEDMLIEDEDFEISIAGKEIIVICTKSYIDLLVNSNT